MAVRPERSPEEGPRSRCAIEHCRWCAREGPACRFCAGTGRWRAERPAADGGVVEWTVVEESCRMCAGTGKEHNPPGEPPEAPLRRRDPAGR
ncbi:MULTISPECIES: hypothetical protein [Nocardiopsis]|uniref:hypothetical protein n=1 Tax=Nocardiopsis TaxID=2013 RepID=UPI000347A578|nr:MULTISPECIES: hypothetical protein [Nocardiopsis]